MKLKKSTKRNLVIVLTFLLLITTSAFALAATPAFTMKAPIPQDVGIADKAYSDFTVAECKSCHLNTVDLHHMTPTALDTSDPTKGCIACHTLTAQGTIATPIDRNCFGCHPTSWHHTTQAAQSGVCTACHEPAILGETGAGLVAPEAPTYSASMVTPKPIDCANCHNDFNPGWDPTIQASTGPISADPNSLSHHGAITDCGFCHDSNVEPQVSGVAVRMCESCHTITTLHTITAHTDTNDKCVGCHGTYIDKVPPVNSALAATVTGLDKARARAYDYVVISGANFGTIADQASVVLSKTDAFGTVINITAPISSLNDAQIRAMIPGTAGPGNYDLYVRAGGKNSNMTAFTVVKAPYISSISPAMGKSGDVLTIKGSSFTVAIDTLTVKFVQGSASNTKIVTPTLVNGDLQVTVPAGMVAGQYLVTVNNAIGVSNSAIFTIGATPKLTSALPNSAAVGKTTVLYGTSLQLGTKPTVKFGAVTAVVGTYSATKIYVTVPAMATGITSVTVNNGFATSNALKFTVK